MSIAEMLHIRDQLAAAGTDPARQAAAITQALEYKDAYYYAGRCLRRVFPKAGAVVAFNPVTDFSGGHDAADQPQADARRDQQ